MSDNSDTGADKSGAPPESSLPFPDSSLDEAPIVGNAAAGTGEQDAPQTPRDRRRRRSRGRVASEWVVVLVVALALAFVIRTFAVQAFFIPSASMEPTLNIGDRILVDKALFSYHSLKEGDIIVFRHPPRDTMCGAPEPDLVKRVIALPGQTIYSKGNNVFVDGKLLSEAYLPQTDPLGTVAIPRTTLPKNEFYVLGDNRAISCDSRYWGPVQGSLIVGKVVLRWWHNGHPDFHIS